MNKLSKAFSLISAFCIILILSFAFNSVWTATKRAIMRSCVSSVAGDIAEYSAEIRKFAQNAENWYVLTDEEAKIIFSNERITFSDCSKLKSQPQDLTQRNPRIAVKKRGEQSFELLIWSKGFDNISGTEDDIGSSSDEKIPD